MSIGARSSILRFFLTIYKKLKLDKGAIAAAVAAAVVPRGALLASSLRATITRNTRRIADPTLLSTTAALRRTFCSSSPSSCPITIKENSPNPNPNSPPPPPPPTSASLDPIKEAADALDIRVGRILKAWRHPEADSLYVEEVNVREAEPRTICSGLVNYVPLDHLQDINVVVLANLKPRNMRGIKSNGMLMAASDASHEVVELLNPPEGSVPGERIWIGSEEEKDQQRDAASPNQVQKKKIWEFVQPHLKTTDACVAVLGERPMRTSAGVVANSTLKNANIS